MPQSRRVRRYTPDRAVRFLEKWLDRAVGDDFMRARPKYGQKLLYAVSDLDPERVPLLEDDSQGVATCVCSPTKRGFDVRVWLDTAYFLSVCRGCDSWVIFPRRQAH